MRVRKGLKVGQGGLDGAGGGGSIVEGGQTWKSKQGRVLPNMRHDQIIGRCDDAHIQRQARGHRAKVKGEGELGPVDLCFPAKEVAHVWDLCAQGWVEVIIIERVSIERRGEESKKKGNLLTPSRISLPVEDKGIDLWCPPRRSYRSR